MAMTLKEQFEQAAKDALELPDKPSTEELLQLYAFYKQGKEGDVHGSRPGMLDLKGRKKFDAWSAIKGTTKDDAMQQYIALVRDLQN